MSVHPLAYMFQAIHLLPRASMLLLWRLARGYMRTKRVRLHLVTGTRKKYMSAIHIYTMLSVHIQRLLC